MKQIFLIQLFLFLAFWASAQTLSKLFGEVKNIEQANKLIEIYPKSEAKLFTVSSEKDTSDITLPLFDKKIGFTFRIDNFQYKIIDTSSHQEFRVSYIYLDGSQYSKKEIDSIRTIILKKFETGKYFYDLVKEYTMDGNPNGDLGWFWEKAMEKDFELAVRGHKKGDVFTVDIPEKKWYYVTLKTFDDRKIKTITLLKIKN
jgi:parvulin-like peptidyl-prolyl isomerase